MIKALLLVFEPEAAWERIFRSQRKLLSILWLHVMPMLVLVALAEGYGLVTWGRWQQDSERLKVFALGEAVVYEVLQLLLMLAVVFIGAKIIKSLGETFHGRHTYLQAFTVVAYGLSPLFLLRLCDAFKTVSPWVSWTIGIVLCVAILYQGVPRIMLPDPPHAFGLYLMSALMLAIITGLARFVTAWYLTGMFKPVEEFILALSAKLPF